MAEVIIAFEQETNPHLRRKESQAPPPVLAGFHGQFTNRLGSLGGRSQGNGWHSGGAPFVVGKKSVGVGRQFFRGRRQGVAKGWLRRRNRLLSHRALVRRTWPPQVRRAGSPRRPGLVEVRAAHKVMAVRADPLALVVLQFVAALRAPAPVFANDGSGFGRIRGRFRRGRRLRLVRGRRHT